MTSVLKRRSWRFAPVNTFGDPVPTPGKARLVAHLTRLGVPGDKIESRVETIIVRLRNVDRVNGCHEWRGVRVWGGYGYMRFPGADEYSHRLAYVAHHGKLDKGFSILHGCDNRACVNPQHLFKGTRLDNIRDMYARRRNLKTTYTDKLEILKRLRAGEEPNNVARAFDIPRLTVENIRRTGRCAPRWD